MFFLEPVLLHAQVGLINNGGYIILNTGANMYVDGNANGRVTNQGAGYFKSDGTISLEGNWINNSTTDAFTSINSTGSVVFKGTTLQEIGGSHLTDFENLTMNNSGPGAFVSINQKIEYTLTMNDGDFDLRNANVYLVQATSTISNETFDKRIKATDGTSDGLGTGTIYTFRDNPSGNVANLGLNFTPAAALGNNTKIIRGHLRQQGSGSFTGNYSIFRYYKIEPVTISQLTVNNFYYFGGGTNPELNSHTEANLQMFQQVQYWNGSTNPVYWEPRPTTVTAGSDYVNSTTTNNAIMLNYILITLASTDKPLPVELTSFSATCADDKVIITWTTASEINNQYFTLEKSINAFTYQLLTTVDGNGNSNTTETYQFIDKPSDGTVYYRLRQTDFDGNEQMYQPISVNCTSSQSSEEDFIILNNPASSEAFLWVKGKEKTNYRLCVFDATGRQLLNKNIELQVSPYTLPLETQTLSNGVYLVAWMSTTHIMTKPLIINKK